MTFAQNVDYDLTKEKSRPAVCSGGGAWGEIIVNGKKYFRERCARRGICCDAWFKLGAQNSVNNGGYVYHCPPELRKDGQRYAVNYVWERELYIAWNVTSPDAACCKVRWRARSRIACWPWRRRRGTAAGEKRRCMSLAETRWMRFWML